MQIQTILNLPFLEFSQRVNCTTGEVKQYPQTASYKVWEIQAFSPALLEIRGSIHRFWNGGTNENDFTLSHAREAIKAFCNLFQLNPVLAQVTNPEFGVNVKPAYSAGEILSQVLCLKNRLAAHPYENNERSYFIEFKSGEAYVKPYDKGKQFKKGNILRFEVKAMKSRCLDFAGIQTLNDLTKKKNVQALGRRLNSVFKEVVFRDDSIEVSTLSKSDYNTYIRMKDAHEWTDCKGSKTRAHRRREGRFKAIVKRYGQRSLYSSIPALIREKARELAKG